MEKNLRIPRKTNARDFSIESFLLRNRGVRGSSLLYTISIREKKQLNLFKDSGTFEGFSIEILNRISIEK